MRQHLFYIALFRQKEIVGRVVLSTLAPALSHDVDDDGDDSHHHPESQKRADLVDQSMLFFLAGANFWEKHAKNCAIMSMAHITYTIAN